MLPFLVFINNGFLLQQRSTCSLLRFKSVYTNKFSFTIFTDKEKLACQLFVFSLLFSLFMKACQFSSFTPRAVFPCQGQLSRVNGALLCLLFFFFYTFITLEIETRFLCFRWYKFVWASIQSKFPYSDDSFKKHKSIQIYKQKGKITDIECYLEKGLKNLITLVTYFQIDNIENYIYLYPTRNNWDFA